MMNVQYDIACKLGAVRRELKRKGKVAFLKPARKKITNIAASPLWLINNTHLVFEIEGAVREEYKQRLKGSNGW